MVLSLFQEAVCNDLVFSRVLYFFETSTCSHPFFQRYWVNSQFQLQPFIRWKALFSIRVIAATHFFKFTVCLYTISNLLCIYIYILIIIPPWFKACIYWKKSVTWWHHFDPSIFSMIVSLFHGSTWSDPHVKRSTWLCVYFTTLVAAIHYNKWSVVDSRKIEVYVYWKKTTVPIYFTELVAVIFVWKALI